MSSLLYVFSSFFVFLGYIQIKGFSFFELIFVFVVHGKCFITYF